MQQLVEFIIVVKSCQGEGNIPGNSECGAGAPGPGGRVLAARFALQPVQAPGGMLRCPSALGKKKSLLPKKAKQSCPGKKAHEQMVIAPKSLPAQEGGLVRDGGWRCPGWCGWGWRGAPSTLQGRAEL